MRRRRHLKGNKAMSGIQFVTDEKGRKVGVLIDLRAIPRNPPETHPLAI